MLAIIIPYYKIDYFEETLKSIANQTNKNFTVYIGNDASKDDPTKLIENTLINLSYKYHYFDKNLGGSNLVAQWDRCINLIDKQEKWFMILGDDDYLSANFVDDFYENLNDISNNKSNVVRFAVNKVSDNKILNRLYTNPKLQTRNDFFFNKERSSLSEYIFSIESYNKYRFKNIPLAWGADVLAVFEFAEAYPIFSINTSTVFVRISDKSISGTKGNSKMNIIKTNALAEVYYYLFKSYAKNFNSSEMNVLYNMIKKLYFNNRSNTHKLVIYLKALVLLQFNKLA